VLLELPHYAAVSESAAGRELVVVRSDDGVSWYDHVTPAPPTDDVVADLLADNFHGACAALRCAAFSTCLFTLQSFCQLNFSTSGT